MSVWLCIPSARPPEEAERVLKLWRERGYRIALWRDYHAPPMHAALVWTQDAPYPGYAVAVNRLIQAVSTMHDQEAEWFVTGGDDIEPDANHSAEEIARECSDWRADTFGVMQPTGDRWHEGVGGFANAPIDRVAGSPWIGREFARRMYGGNGPYWPDYKHMFVDEEIQCVAEKFGVFWQRRDLIHLHRHWGRGATDKAIVNDPVIPKHLEKWNTREHWQESKKMFTERKAAGFPGHEPL